MRRSLRTAVSASLLAIACGSGDGEPDPVDGVGGTSAGNGGSAGKGGGTVGGTGGTADAGRGGSATAGRGGSANAGSSTGGKAGRGAGASGGGAGGRDGGVSGVGGAGSNSAGESGTGPGGGGGSTAGTGVGGVSVSGNGGASGAGGSGGSAPGCGTETGFYVEAGQLFDKNCNEFVLRGVNYPYTWFSTRNAQQDLTAIAQKGANAVRLVLSSGGRWTRTSGSTLASLIEAAKAAKLVSIVEVHDTTGYSEQSGSVALTNATSYWTASEIADVLEGQEAFVIVNLGNEPNGNNTSTSWASSHVTSVQALRSAGFTHTLMVDAPNWGQDWENTMRNGGGSSIWTADSLKNLVFSVHMYDVYGMASTVTTYFNTFLMNYDAPLVVGEFAADHGSSGNVDEDTIMSFAETLGIGYLGWSWAGNGEGLGTLDITNDFDANSLTTWGERLINGANGLVATSEPCTCFD
jgi:mannan endo-1,4-beta-mannosidase